MFHYIFDVKAARVKAGQVKTGQLFGVGVPKWITQCWLGRILNMLQSYLTPFQQYIAAHRQGQPNIIYSSKGCSRLHTFYIHQHINVSND